MENSLKKLLSVLFLCTSMLNATSVFAEDTTKEDPQFDDKTCGEIDIYRESRSSHFSCHTPGRSTFSFQELGRLISNKDKPDSKKHEFAIKEPAPIGYVYTGATASVSDSGNQITICKTATGEPEAGGPTLCATYKADAILHYARSTNYCGATADLYLPVEMDRFNDPKRPLKTNSVIPIPLPSLGGATNPTFTAYEAACYKDDITTKKKRPKKIEKDLRKKFDKFYTACSNAAYAYWDEVDNKFDKSCEVYLMKKAGKSVEEITKILSDREAAAKKSDLSQKTDLPNPVQTGEQNDGKKKKKKKKKKDESENL